MHVTTVKSLIPGVTVSHVSTHFCRTVGQSGGRISLFLAGAGCFSTPDTTSPSTFTLVDKRIDVFRKIDGIVNRNPPPMNSSIVHSRLFLRGKDDDVDSNRISFHDYNSRFPRTNVRDHDKRERLANAPLSKRHPIKLTLSGAAHAFVYPVNRAEVAVSGHQDASFTNLYVPHFRWRSR